MSDKYIPRPAASRDLEADVITRLQKARHGYWTEPQLMEMALDPNLKPVWTPPAPDDEIEAILTELRELGFPAAETAYRPFALDNADRDQMRKSVAGALHYRTLETGKSDFELCIGLSQRLADDFAVSVSADTLRRWLRGYREKHPRDAEMIENYFTHRKALGVPRGYRDNASLAKLIEPAREAHARKQQPL